ncbi:replication endonuclease [Enterovibrio coralii]|uniref:Replication protein n=1 Tax=Enterovibrio coralii TaxID=294935 RepID=A0A135I6Y0_9GAMM|nr:replication endonuclease [Enterovibrio coralii]KXF81212.1 replication protein [Enterovibrio coralii]
MLTPFAHHFMPKLPRIVQDDVHFQVSGRSRRANATRENMTLFINDTVKHALKWAPVIEHKFPFADLRVNASHQRVHSGARSSVTLNHETLMCDDAIERLAVNLTEMFTRQIQMIQVEDGETAYLNALKTVFVGISKDLRTVHLTPPPLKKKHTLLAEAEDELERAICRCLDVKYLVRKFTFLRTQYIEYSQIALARVGDRKSQHAYLSRRSFARWEKKQQEAARFVKAMSVVCHETGETFDLAEVVKRTTANPENRRIELVVRSRGDEERAVEMGYEGVFVNWTLPSKYHRNADKWTGCTPKEAHEVLMAKWRLARAWFQKLDIHWFGLRVAEPHKDGTPHAHMFLYVHPDQKAALVSIIESVAIDEDKHELMINGALNISPRITIKHCDPALGTATGYIIKYISKNINGAHLPEGDAAHTALSATAWARIHRIKQFSQSGSPPVGLWRQIRRASKEDVAFDAQLADLHEHCDKSRWSRFCQDVQDAQLAYETRINGYGETVKKVRGFMWHDIIIETAGKDYSLVPTAKVDTWKAARHAVAIALKKARRAFPWSTENKCNPPPYSAPTGIEHALITVTGWSLKGVQCLISPLLRGATVPIDNALSLSWRDGELQTHAVRGAQTTKDPSR